MPVKTKSWKSSGLGFFLALTGPTLALAEDFEVITPTKSSLEVIENEIRVELSHYGCSDGHEIACKNTNMTQRSEYVSTHSYRHGDRVNYSFEIYVDPDFTYNALGKYLRAVRFLNSSDHSIFNFTLGTESGYTANLKTCFGLEGFGEWHLVEVHVNWDSTRKKNIKHKTPGELRVICDGVEVLSRSGRPNIGVEEEVRLALGMYGALDLADGDNVKIRIRNVKAEKQ
jgi:hypothetical protein